MSIFKIIKCIYITKKIYCQASQLCTVYYTQKSYKVMRVFNKCNQGEEKANCNWLFTLNAHDFKCIQLKHFLKHNFISFILYLLSNTKFSLFCVLKRLCKTGKDFFIII